MRLLVCGGRDYHDRETVFRELDKLAPALVIHGGAPGADTLAATWCVATRTPELRFPAEWSLYGKAAGPLRNQQMLDEGKPTLVLAFPGGRGTADMIRRARKAGIPVNNMDNRRGDA